MKILNYFFVLVFILFAAVQYNDPDPYLWIPIYLYPAYLCLRAAQEKPLSKILYHIGFVFFGVYAVYKMFDQNGVVDWIRYHNAVSIAATMKAETPWVEESREFFGLIIILMVLGYNYLKELKKK